MQAGMKPDPPVRKDGKCALPGCGNNLVTAPPKTMPKTLRKTFMKNLIADPWCSSTCAREYHGCPIRPDGPQHGQTSRSLHVPICGEHSGYKSGCRCARCMEWMRVDQRRRRDRIKREGGLRPGHKHSAASYRNGCRCDGCRKAYRPWQKEKRARKQEAA